jgi:hypothetical protein
VQRIQALALFAVPLLAACAANPPPATRPPATTRAATTRAATARAGAAHGIVTGRLVLEGGPLGPGERQPGERPIPGTIRFTAAGRHRLFTARAGKSGTFAVLLPPGTYQVSGRSPRVMEVSNGTSRQTPCSQPRSVTVTERHTVKITLACIVP